MYSSKGRVKLVRITQSPCCSTIKLAHVRARKPFTYEFSIILYMIKLIYSKLLYAQMLKKNKYNFKYNYTEVNK